MRPPQELYGVEKRLIGGVYKNVYRTDVGDLTTVQVRELTGLSDSALTARVRRYGADGDMVFRAANEARQNRTKGNLGNEEWQELCRRSRETEARRLASINNLRPLGTWEKTRGDQ